MRFIQFKSILPLFTLVLLTFSCGNNNTPRNIIIAGDRESVDIFNRIRPSELPQVSEQVNNGFNWTSYSKLIDVNGDESFDLAVAFVEQTNVLGDANYYTSINKFNSTLEIMGTEQELFGQTNWAATMVGEGERVNLDAGEWRSFDSEIYLSWLAAEAVVETTNYNLFPSPESRAYLFWRLTNLDGRSVVGWLHLEQTNDNLRPLVLDSGYKFIN